MSTFAQSQRQKEIKQCALELNKLSKIESNRICADCEHKPAKWVSITFGCWLCSKCAGIHRGLGVHITFIKSSTLDDWNYELLNKFKSLGGNEAVNKIYESKLKKREKINHETNEYRSIDFITQKYVEKKWMIKKQHHHKKKNDKKLNRKRSESKPKKQDKDIPDLLNFNHEYKSYDDDKPSNWVKFTENEDEIKAVHVEDGDDMMPSLLNLNEMHNFAFSDLSKANNIYCQDIMDIDNDNSINKLDKAAILSMYKSDNNGNNNNNNNNNTKLENKDKKIEIAKFNPFDYINDIVGNAGSYVYSANVSC